MSHLSVKDQLARDFFASAEVVRVAIDLARSQNSEPQQELERAWQLIEHAHGIVRQRADFHELATVGTQGAVFMEGVAGVPVLNALPVVIGPNGHLGTVSASSLRGPKGDTGDTGPQGLKGDKGDQGPAGTNGTDGDGLIPGSILYLASDVTPPSGYTLIGSDQISMGGKTKKRPTYQKVNIYLKN